MTTVSSDSVPLTGCILGGTGWSRPSRAIEGPCCKLGEHKHSPELEEIVDPDPVLFMFMFISLAQMFIAILILCSSKNVLLSPLLLIQKRKS